MLPAVGGKLPDIFPPATESGTHMRKKGSQANGKRKHGEAGKKRTICRDTLRDWPTVIY